MKKIIFMLVCLLGMATTTSAQSAYAKARGSQSNRSYYKIYDGWKGIRVAYHPMSATTTTKSASSSVSESYDFTGLSAGYMQGFSISTNAPIYMEAGVNLLYSFNGESEFSMVSLNVPLNIGYKYEAGESLVFYPHIGVNFRLNVFGEEYGVNLFDADVWGDDTVKRINLGWTIGVSAHFNEFVVTASYGKDFTEYQANAKFVMPTLSVGYNF